MIVPAASWLSILGVTFELLTLGSAAQLPAPWRIAVKKAPPDVSVVTVDGERAVCLFSQQASFSIQRAVDVDPITMPILHIRWRADELPPNADFRTARDDQAAQFFVVFDRAVGFDAINYIWDTTAPVGSSGSYEVVILANIKTVVVRSGPRDVGTWLDFERNVVDDYRRLFGRPAPPVRAVRFQVNSQHTGSRARGCLARAWFTSP